uniref:Death domain-containing protein n=1 Tax=Branchiostoma floridae TaxID=7739 RepID=C3ZSU3_BRAFL|eukprot:XP_002588484.1 hypothetical protein BRAFLDRAFT_63432 [Branchiostoma floridae]
MAGADARRYFDFIKENASKDWENLLVASCLGVEWTVIERIEAANPDDKSRCMDMLEHWRQRNGKRATMEVLMRALSMAGLHDTLDDLNYKYPGEEAPGQPPINGLARTLPLSDLVWTKTMLP